MALSMPTADAKTPAPTYGTSSSSRSPCTVPSSPKGPCNSGITTVDPLADAALRASADDTARPVASSRVGIASGPWSSAAIADSARCHWPDRSMPRAVTVYRSGFTAFMTWAAVEQLTSCSADWPPKMMTRLMRSVPLLSMWPTVRR